MKKLFLFLLFLFNISYANNVVNNIKLLNNEEYNRIVFSLDKLPEYFVESTDEFINLRFSNTTVEQSVIDNFKKINNTDCLELLKSQKYLRFRIYGEFKRYIYIKPSEYNKNHRVIIDIYKQKNDNIDDFLSNRILLKTEEKKEKTLDDIVNISLEEKQNTLDDVLNEIIELKILEKEIRKEQDDLAKLTSKVLIDNKKEVKVKKEYFTVVIDAGHGGKDPGTISKKRTREKDINLEYALLLKKELSKNKKIKVHLTRSNDTFLSLTDRLNVARKFTPDLFISLHADSSPNIKTRGLSIYTLSKEASDTRTADLAMSENKSNIIGGMNLYNEYQDTINTLVDLSRKEILQESYTIANNFVKNFEKNNINLMDRPHRQANFAVLLAPDFPSVLIELGFLSNTKDEKMMKSNSYKKTFSKAVCETVEKLFH